MRSRLAGSAVALSVPVVALAVAVWAIATPTFLRWEFQRSGFPPAPGISDQTRLALAAPSTLYLTRPGIDEADLAGLTLDEAPLYTPEEISHLVDVRRLVRILTALGLVGTVTLLASGLAAIRQRRLARVFGSGLLYGGLGTTMAVAVVGLSVAVAWPLVFVGFHELLFPPDTWQFPATSGLIRLFPERFWFDTAVALGIVVAAAGAVAAGAGAVIYRRAGRAGGQRGMGHPAPTNSARRDQGGRR